MSLLLENPHPGVILKEEFLNDIELSQNKLAEAINVPPNRIHAIIKGSRKITADTDLRLSNFFGLSQGYWLHLQNEFDLMEAKRSGGELFQRITPFKNLDHYKAV